MVRRNSTLHTLVQAVYCPYMIPAAFTSSMRIDTIFIIRYDYGYRLSPEDASMLTGCGRSMCGLISCGAPGKTFDYRNRGKL